MTPTTEPLPALVLLAAGGSRRLGRPKQLLTRGGIPLVRRVAELGLQLPLARRLVITGSGSAAVRDALAGLPLELIQHPGWAAGMGSSIQAAVRHLDDHAGACLFLTVDQPALELAHLQALLAAASARPQQDIASGYAGLAGIPALLRRPTWHLGLGLSGDTGLRHLLRASAGSLQILPAPQLALDIDTPENLRQAVRLGWLDPLPDH